MENDSRISRRLFLKLCIVTSAESLKNPNQQEPPFEDVLEEKTKNLITNLNNTGFRDDANRISSGVIAHQELFKWFAINKPEAVTKLYSPSSLLYEPPESSNFTSHIPKVWIKIRNNGVNLLSSHQAKAEYYLGINKFSKSIENLVLLPELVSIFIEQNLKRFSKTVDVFSEISEKYVTLQTQYDLVSGVLAIQRALLGDLYNHPIEPIPDRLASNYKSQDTLAIFESQTRNIAFNWLANVKTEITGQFPFGLNENLDNIEVFIPLTQSNGQFAA